MRGAEEREMDLAVRRAKQDRHAARFVANVAILKASKLVFIERSTALLFREEGKPAVDFYPHTGRWRKIGLGPAYNATMGGGAQAFLEWYNKIPVQAGPRPRHNSKVLELPAPKARLAAQSWHCSKCQHANAVDAASRCANCGVAKPAEDFF